jgi:transposase
MTSIPHHAAPQLTIGVDTHLEVHVAHANDQLGRPVATLQIPTTPAGYQQLLGWAHELGEPIVWGGRAPAATALGRPASWPQATRSWSRSTDPTAKPGA